MLSSPFIGITPPFRPRVVYQMVSSTTCALGNVNADSATNYFNDVCIDKNMKSSKKLVAYQKSPFFFWRRVNVDNDLSDDYTYRFPLFLWPFHYRFSNASQNLQTAYLKIFDYLANKDYRFHKNWNFNCKVVYKRARDIVRNLSARKLTPVGELMRRYKSHYVTRHYLNNFVSQPIECNVANRCYVTHTCSTITENFIIDLCFRQQIRCIVLRDASVSILSVCNHDASNALASEFPRSTR